MKAYSHGPKVAVPPVTMRGQGLAVQLRPDKIGNDEHIAGDGDREVRQSSWTEFGQEVSEKCEG